MIVSCYKSLVRIIHTLTLLSMHLMGHAFAGVTPIKCDIGGIVKDSITGEGLPFASVQIWTENDSVAEKGVMTDENGHYTIEGITPGLYSVVATYMGYNTATVTIDIQAKKEKVDFMLSQKSYSLSEIKITAEKQLIEKTIEKTTINVAKNTTLTGGTAQDIMQTLPAVDVDINGNIFYRGSDKVVILLNGEKSELVKSLGQIPADQVEKIELITNPSARYDAEGMSGIINIVLKSGITGRNETTLMLYAGYPETMPFPACYP